MSLSEKIFDRVIGHAVSLGVFEVVHADGTVARFGTPTQGFPDVRVRLADDKVARDILRDPGLGAGETFMDGRLVIEQGDIMDLITLLSANSPWDHGRAIAAPGLKHRVANTLGAAYEAVNRQASARKNISHHYDIGNDLYRLMLDTEYMQYSCAYWPSTDVTLEQAQVAKLAHIAAKLALKPGNTVLDIGCGWGGMAIYLAQHADVTITGITLSKEQLALARENAERAGVADRVRFELIDYRDMAARGDSFDRIVSVGMFEHVGVPQFETFFRACASLLKVDGVMLLHTIGRLGGPGKTDAFTRKYIFPGGYIPALSETLERSEKVRLIASDIETLRLHYAWTLRAWYDRCVAHRETIEAAYGAPFFRMWTFYLAGATAAFESGGMCNYQIQYIRDRHALPVTRDYLAGEEARLTGQ